MNVVKDRDHLHTANMWELSFMVLQNSSIRGIAYLTDMFTGKIEFKGVWFRYPTRLHEWVFKGLDLTIEPNDTIAIVGESGQGKSTFINLVMRFYDPEFGEILIDGVDIKSYDIRELRRSMGLVMQEPTLFNYSIRDNILYGKPQASNQEIREAV